MISAARAAAKTSVAVLAAATAARAVRGSRFGTTGTQEDASAKLCGTLPISLDAKDHDLC